MNAQDISLTIAGLGTLVALYLAWRGIQLQKQNNNIHNERVIELLQGISKNTKGMKK